MRLNRFMIILTSIALGLSGAVLVPPAPGQGKPSVSDSSATPKAEAKKGRGYKPLTPERRAALQAQSHAQHGGRIQMLLRNQVLPAAFDCRSKGWAMPVGDQGQCGSCYGYSTIQTITNAFIKAGYGKPDGSFFLSVQFIMDCHNFGGCDGGNGNEVVDWLCKNGGLPAEKYVDVDGKTHNDYPPYEARSASCRKVPNAKMWVPASWGYVNANGKPSVDEIKAAMFNYGTLNVALDAGGQFGNGSGTITSMGDSIDHEIQCIGWDDAKDGGCFLLQNQWNTDWGDNGYRWVTYSASKHIVDWFFVTAAVLPPPPIPPGPGPVPPVPIPPGPGPTPSNITITLTTDQVQAVLTQSGATLLTKQMTVAELLIALEKLKQAESPAKPCCGKTVEQRLDEQEQSLKEIAKALITIQKKVAPEK